MATLLNVTSERPETGKKVTKKLSNVNPSATNENVKLFATALHQLSKNTLKNIEKVSKTNLEIPEV